MPRSAIVTRVRHLEHSRSQEAFDPSCWDRAVAIANRVIEDPAMLSDALALEEWVREREAIDGVPFRPREGSIEAASARFSRWLKEDPSVLDIIQRINPAFERAIRAA